MPIQSTRQQRLWPHTGRHHQLRVLLSSLGIPIVNDSYSLTGEWRYFESRRSL